MCAFRDLKDELSKLGTEIFGVSPDGVEDHEKFHEKFDLNFSLLADVGHKVSEKYGAWREKNMYGKTTLGIQRSTYIIDSEGKVAKVWKRVQVDGHAEKVLQAVKEL